MYHITTKSHEISFKAFSFMPLKKSFDKTIKLLIKLIFSWGSFTRMRRSSFSHNKFSMNSLNLMTKMQSKGFDPMIASVKCKCTSHYTVPLSVIAIIFLMYPSLWIIAFIEFSKFIDSASFSALTFRVHLHSRFIELLRSRLHGLLRFFSIEEQQ